jgi:hypothetical protein
VLCVITIIVVSDRSSNSRTLPSGPTSAKSTKSSRGCLRRQNRRAFHAPMCEHMKKSPRVCNQNALHVHHCGASSKICSNLIACASQQNAGTWETSISTLILVNKRIPEIDHFRFSSNNEHSP